MIRYTKDYNREIARIVKNYNARVKRLKNRNVYTPAHVKVSDLKKLYFTRQDLNTRLKELELFNAKTALTTNRWGGTLYEEKLAQKRLRRAQREIEARIEYARSKEKRAINYVDSHRYSYERTSQKLANLNRLIRSKKATPREYSEYIRLVNNLGTGSEKAGRLRDNLLQMIRTYASWVGVPYNKLVKALDRVANISLDRIDALSKYSALFQNWLNNYSIMNDIQSGIVSLDDIYDSGEASIDELLRALSDTSVLGFD